MALNRIIFLSIIFLVFACSKESEYNQMVERELAKTMRQDSLFLGLKFGMTQKEFFNHCWELNQKKAIKEGPQSQSVEYKMSKELSKPAVMNFYPEFHDDKIYQMPVSITYEAWAPWNKNLFSDSLQLDVLKFFEKHYGKGFIKIEHPQKGIAYVKMDSNRRISIYKKNDSDVSIIFTDMLIDQKVKK
ncbi:hypothetical protein BH23BAC1_BH23BAC1_17160 [soil metagenome]